MRVRRIHILFPFLSKLFAFYLEQFLSGDVVERVKSVVATVLETVAVLDLQLGVVQLLLYDFTFSELDLFLPAGRTVEFFIVFAEVKTPVIQTFIEIFRRYLLAILLKFTPTPRQLHQLLPQPRQHNNPRHLRMHASQHNSHNLSRIYGR